MSQPILHAAQFPSLADKSVFITGGAGGIGAATVERFCANGARVTFADISAERGASLCQRLSSYCQPPLFQQLDLRDIEALRSAMHMAERTHGPLDVLVNNAADDTRHTLDELTPAYWDDRIAVNLSHMAFAAQEAARQMKGRGGAIINLGSISWKLANSGYVAYATCKAAVHGLTRSLARELGPDNIRVNTVTPGWVMTERQLELWMDAKGEAEIEARQCLNVRLLPDDIAAMVAFLAADDARCATAQDFTIDGGWS